MLNFKQYQEVRRNMRKYIYETRGQGSLVSKFCNPSLLKEMLNYKPKNMSDNRKLTPEILQELGWKLEGLVPYDKFCKHLLFKKFGSDCPPGAQCMDHFTYEWELYILPFNTFGTWKGCEFIIEQTTSGGFMGIHKKCSIFRGYLDTVEDYHTMCKLTRIK